MNQYSNTWTLQRRRTVRLAVQTVRIVVLTAMLVVSTRTVRLEFRTELLLLMGRTEKAQMARGTLLNFKHDNQQNLLGHLHHLVPVPLRLIAEVEKAEE